MKEKEKIRFHRIIWLAVLLIFIFLPIIYHFIIPLRLINDRGYIDNYYYYLNQSSVTIHLTFNRKVSSGYATIRYYDSSNNLLDTQKNYFSAYNSKEAECYLNSVQGHVSSYSIVSYEFRPTFALGWMYYFLLPIILFFISSFTLNYKEYDYQEKKISIYSGWYHHTLRVDGEIFDEHNTLTSFTPIKLSTTLDNKFTLEATITLTNRISLKINDQLVKPNCKNHNDVNNSQMNKNKIDNIDKKETDFRN